MIKKIISTILIRGVLACLNFFLAILTTQYLGPEGKGDVSLFVLNLTIVQLVNNFVGGPYLVYLVPRKNSMHLLLLSYAWSLITSVAIPLMLLIFHLADVGNFFHLVLLSVIFSFISINTMIMVGKEEVNKYNITSLTQTLVLITAFFIYVESFGIKNLSSYINAMYFSGLVAATVSLIFIIKHFKKISFTGIVETFTETLKKGFVLQAGAIAQMFNYRLSFYILDQFHEGGRKEVGIYSVAVSLAEALWLVSQSVALVLYSRISNSDDVQHSRKLTVALIKIVFLCTIICTGILLCLPSGLFTFVFGDGFGGIKTVLFPLSTGIVIFSAGIIFSSYFVGQGKPQVSVFASMIGLVITLSLGFILIPRYGMMGAGITASASYTAGVLYQFIAFMKEAKELTFRDFLFTRNDFNFVFLELKQIIFSKQVQ